MIPNKVIEYLHNNLRKIFEDFSKIDLRGEIDCDLTIVTYGFLFSDIEQMPYCNVIKGNMEKVFHISLLDWSLLGSIGYSDEELKKDFVIFNEWLNQGENKIKLIDEWDSVNNNNTYLHYIEKEHDEHVEPFNVEKTTYNKVKNDVNCWYELDSYWGAKGEVRKGKKKMKHYKKMIWENNKKEYLKEFILEPIKSFIRFITYLTKMPHVNKNNMIKKAILV